MNRTKKGRSKFGDALAAALTTRGMTQRELGGRVGGVAQSAVSAWCSGHTQPSPSTVFAVERVLKLAPGHLSRHLGYVPLDGVETPPASVEQAIAGDPLLDPTQKRGMLALYREFVGRRKR